MVSGLFSGNYSGLSGFALPEELPIVAPTQPPVVVPAQPPVVNDSVAGLFSGFGGISTVPNLVSNIDISEYTSPPVKPATPPPAPTRLPPRATTRPPVVETRPPRTVSHYS